MTDLDEKLKELFLEQADGGGDVGYPAFEEELLPKIKQAFKDAGYEKLDVVESRVMNAMEQLAKDIRAERKCMTGQEWYDRFKKEFVADDRVSYNGNMLAVARRASGIE